MFLPATMLYLCLVVGSISGARILGIFPTPSISHQLPFQAVMKALAARGHQVTVLSTDPLKTPHGNHTDIDLSFTYEFWAQFDFSQTNEAPPWKMMKVFTGTGKDICRMQLSSKQVQDFLKSSPRFDVVFIESLFYQCYYGLIHRLGSPPIIGLLSIGGISAMFDAVGGPNNPAYDPDMAIPYSDHMTFIERLHNTLYSYWIRYHWYYELMVEQEAVMREFFGDDPPTVWETERNFSMMMVNNHWSMNYVRPTMPAYVELGSLHLQTETKPLPEDLRKFLDEAQDGFIYFSLGSNIRSDKMPAAKQAEFLAAFAQLKPLRVLWKWESESLPGQSNNVKLVKWLPQQDVLGHPNIRLFITQGGLQSFQEAVHSAVPLVGIPFLADQRQNVQKMILSGIGKKLDFEEINQENILKTIKTVVYEPSYRENMKKMSEINKDQPQTPLERAVWWTEYVIRHKGAKHLRAASLDLAWYQYLLLDVVAAILAAVSVTVYVVFVAIRLIYQLVFCKKCKTKKTVKKVSRKGRLMNDNDELPDKKAMTRCTLSNVCFTIPLIFSLSCLAASEFVSVDRGNVEKTPAILKNCDFPAREVHTVTEGLPVADLDEYDGFVVPIFGANSTRQNEHGLDGHEKDDIADVENFQTKVDSKHGKQSSREEVKKLEKEIERIAEGDENFRKSMHRKRNEPKHRKHHQLKQDYEPNIRESEKMGNKKSEIRGKNHEFAERDPEFRDSRHRKRSGHRHNRVKEHRPVTLDGDGFDASIPYNQLTRRKKQSRVPEQRHLAVGGESILATLFKRDAPIDVDDWGYCGDMGPEKWQEKWPDCGGNGQSPINLDTSVAKVDYEPILKWKGYSNTPSKMTLINNGHSVVLTTSYEDCGSRPHIWDSIMNHEYVFGELTFHWGADESSGSEHTLNYLKYPLEMQVVHYRRELGSIEKAQEVPGGLAIVSILYHLETGKRQNQGITDIQTGFSKVHDGPASTSIQPFPLSRLIPQFSKHYLSYNGSMTTPPCTETVIWIVHLKQASISKKQLSKFHQIKNEGVEIKQNNRPIQKSNKRCVLEIT